MGSNKAGVRKKQKIRRRRKIELIQDRLLDKWAKEQVASLRAKRDILWAFIAFDESGSENFFLSPTEPTANLKYKIYLPSLMNFREARQYFDEHEKEFLEFVNGSGPNGRGARFESV